VAASEAAPALPEVEVRISGSQILSDTSDPALVEHVSNATVSELQSLFHWEAVNTTYRGIRTFWRIATPGTSREIDAKTYREWTELWPAETDTHAEQLAWKLAPPRRPLDTVTSDDFKSDVPEPPANASDTRPEGADFNLLPQPPAAGQ
jgi:hypothetical protein